MSLKKDYILPLYGEIKLIISVNIGWTLSLWLKSPTKITTDTYIDGNADFLMANGEVISIGTAQDFGSLMDLLNAPSDFFKLDKGLLKEGIIAFEGTLMAIRGSEICEMIFIRSQAQGETLKFPILQDTLIAFEIVKKQIIEDLNLMFSAKNVALISRLSKER
jgi:hypothetical protein